ncbi:Crp/Fnr family transcriptional regulator [Sphingobium boeckii]|uniref:CRP-like cAMP-binding protein n=1 Tax=Sphingobium boeckii TaxID=1082345 RepID=A0A7W9AG49_9SPHN|nr:Crp/Fnr family transcriptional regulator [Sphingobium boeckii]MBB5684897.1 CRP-like cAMP-binding protein [Sphingobium boeckii]
MPYSSNLAVQIFLDRLGSRTKLGSEEMDVIRSLPGQKITAGGDRDLVRPGDSVDHACLIVDGVVGRFGQMRDGRRQITAFYVAGHMANLQSVVFPSTGASLQALSPVTIIRMPHKALKAAAAKYPALADAFWRECAVDACVLAQWIVNLGRKSAVARMAHLLAELGLRMEEAGLGTSHRYRLELTQVHLGDALGLTSVHVNRVFRQLREAKVVTVSKRVIEICDWNALISIGEFDRDYLHIDTKCWDLPSHRREENHASSGISMQM